jgi:hypothetical protein
VTIGYAGRQAYEGSYHFAGPEVDMIISCISPLKYGFGSLIFMPNFTIGAWLSTRPLLHQVDLFV